MVQQTKMVQKTKKMVPTYWSTIFVSVIYILAWNLTEKPYFPTKKAKKKMVTDHKSQQTAHSQKITTETLKKKQKNRNTTLVVALHYTIYPFFLLLASKHRCVQLEECQIDSYNAVTIPSVQYMSLAIILLQTPSPEAVALLASKSKANLNISPKRNH